LGGVYLADRTREDDAGSIELQAGGTDRTTVERSDQLLALFGEGTYRPGERLALTAGLRFQHDARRMTRGHNLESNAGTTPLAPDVDVSDDWNALQPRLTVSFELTSNHALHATVWRGHQSGGFNPASDDSTAVRYEPAQSWNYELGVQSGMFDNRLRVAAVAFFSETDDYQVFRPTPTLTALNYQMMNAARATTAGVGLEVEYEPVKRLEFDLAFGWTHAEFDEFVDAFSGADFGGNRINLVPEFTTTFGVQYTCSFGLFTRVETQVVGDMWFDEANTVKQSAHAVLNARLGYEFGDFEVFAFGRNLTDERYFNNALDFGHDYGGPLLGTPGDPLTFGIGVGGTF
jgi:iron complex outermembrane receptor protein